MIKNKFEQYFRGFKAESEDVKALTSSLLSRDISLPCESTQKLENEIAKFFKLDYALTHCNGTSAILTAMYGVGIKKGDEVMCPTYTWWASISPALVLGAKPVFCDINSRNLTIDPDDIKRKITNKTRAIVVPHLWGNCVDIIKIKEIVKKISHKIYIIEDFSHIVGAKLNDEYLGSFGDVGVFSMQASKILTAGEGGMLITSDKNIYNRAVFFGHYERIKILDDKNLIKYKNTGGGFKFRINPLGASLALSQLKTLKKRTKKQNKLTSYFESELEKIKNIKLFNTNPKTFIKGGIINLKGKIVIKENTKIKELEKLCIKKDYFSLLHLEPFFIENKSRFTGQNVLSQSEELHKDLFSFPVFYRGTKKIIDDYVKKIKHLL